MEMGPTELVGEIRMEASLPPSTSGRSFDSLLIAVSSSREEWSMGTAVDGHGELLLRPVGVCEEAKSQGKKTSIWCFVGWSRGICYPV